MVKTMFLAGCIGAGLVAFSSIVAFSQASFAEEPAPAAVSFWSAEPLVFHGRTVMIPRPEGMCRASKFSGAKNFVAALWQVEKARKHRLMEVLAPCADLEAIDAGGDAIPDRFIDITYPDDYYAQINLTPVQYLEVYKPSAEKLVEFMNSRDGEKMSAQTGYRLLGVDYPDDGIVVMQVDNVLNRKMFSLGLGTALNMRTVSVTYYIEEQKSQSIILPFAAMADAMRVANGREGKSHTVTFSPSPYDPTPEEIAEKKRREEAAKAEVEAYHKRIAEEKLKKAEIEEKKEQDEMADRITSFLVLLGGIAVIGAMIVILRKSKSDRR